MTDDSKLSYALIAVSDSDGATDASTTASTSQSCWPLALSFLACSLTAGIIPGQTLFIEFFVNSGIFGSICTDAGHELGCDDQYLQMTNMLNSVSVLVVMSSLVTGEAFDRWGAQSCAIVGALIVSGAFALMASLIVIVPFFPDQNVVLSYSLIFMVVVADFGAYLNSFAMLGLAWHYPNNQSLLVSLLNTTYQVGAFFAVGVQAIMQMFNVGVAIPMYGWAFAQILVSFVLWKVVPTKEEYLLQAKLVLGVPLPSPKEEADLWTKTKGACSVIRFDLTAHFALALGFVFGQTTAYYYQSMAVPFGSALFGSKQDGATFGTLCSTVNGIIGLLTGPFAGWLVDRFGLGIVVACQVALPAVFGLTCTIKSWTVATVAAASSFSFTSISSLLVSRWFLCFSPPNRLGMVTGVFYVVAYLVVLVFCTLMTCWSQEAATDVNPNRFNFPLLLGSVCSVLGSCLFAIYYWYLKPCPDVPRLLPEDEVELARIWGFKSLEEIGKVLEISDQALLIKKLTATNAEEINEISSKLQAFELSSAANISNAAEAVASLEHKDAKPLDSTAILNTEALLGA